MLVQKSKSKIAKRAFIINFILQKKKLQFQFNN